MPFKRFILLIFVLGLLAIFLWFVVNINRNIVISSFATSLDGRTDAQIENLQLAAVKIDGIVLKPGEIFSFNEMVGERLRRWGYKGAPTIYQGRIVDTPGGGICQLSSTIYNAALLAGLDIIERTPHIWTINSVGPGRDAAVLYGKNESIDLKFRNNLDFPIKLAVEIGKNRAFVRIFGPKKPDRQVSLEVQTLQTFPAPRYPHYPHNKPGYNASGGRDGCKVKVYRIFHSNGKIVEKEIVSVDKYEPVPGVEP